MGRRPSASSFINHHSSFIISYSPKYAEPREHRLGLFFFILGADMARNRGAPGLSRDGAGELGALLEDRRDRILADAPGHDVGDGDDVGRALLSVSRAISPKTLPGPSWATSWPPVAGRIVDAQGDRAGVTTNIESPASPA